MHTRYGVILVGLVLAGRPTAAEDAARYVAVLRNGTRLEAKQLTDWHSANSDPKLDGKRLLDANNPLRWLRDRSLGLSSAPAAFVEMVGADRLPGEVVGYQPSSQSSYDSLPACFLVAPATELNRPGQPPREHLRVLRRHVRRIVWQRQYPDRYLPGTLIYRDGRSIRFRSARFHLGGREVQVLVDTRQRSVPFQEIAELHLPAPDPWEIYFDEVAQLSPELASPLVQWETSDGLAVTSSAARFDVTSSGGPRDADRWIHSLQPAWSPDRLWVRCGTICVRRRFAPEQVPLVRFRPENALPNPRANHGWNWQVNRNVRGDVLVSGEQEFGWGLGVHAPSELRWRLPACARKFRSQIGLDRAAQRGGCVRARVYVGSTGSPPLYESPFLVGSEKTLDVGDRQLTDPTAAADRHLILQVDAAHAGRPAGADPLNIRDIFDWLEPVLTLDRQLLTDEIARRRVRQFPAWQGWDVTLAPHAKVHVKTVLDKSDPTSERYDPGVVAEGGPLTLTRTLVVEPRDRWLVVSASRQGDFSERPRIEVRLNGVSVVDQTVPLARSGERHPLPLIVPVAPFRGRRIELQLIQHPSDARAPVNWHAIRLVDGLPTLYAVFEDEGRLVAVDGADAAVASLVSEPVRSGTRAAQLPAGVRFRLALPRAVPIREHPRWGEYRHLRFALSKQGAGRALVQLERQGAQQDPLGYDAGGGAPAFAGARRVWTTELPGAWILITRDLFADFGEIDLTGLVLGAPDGESLLVDHVYLAKTPEDFRLTESVATNTGLWQHVRDLSQVVGRTLICDEANNRVVELGPDGKPTWEIEVPKPWGCRGLASGHRLIASFESQAVFEYDAEGKLVWSKTELPGGPTSVERLPSGNTLVACTDSQLVVEITPAGEIAWQAKVDGRPFDARRLSNGRTLVTLHQGQRIVEIDPSGNVLWQATGLKDPQCAQRLYNGNTLVADHGNKRIVEFNSSSQVVWSKGFPHHVFDAQRLPNGQTLVAHAQGFVLLDGDEKVIWEQAQEIVSRARAF